MSTAQELINMYFPLFLESNLRREIEDVALLKKTHAGDVLIDIGQKISTIPLVTKGSIKIIREDKEGRELFLYYVEPGNTCAVSLTCCVSGQKSSIRAIAEEDTEYMAIPLRYLDEWMIKYPSWKAFVMGTYANRFEELLRAIDQLAFKKMDDRLIKYLRDKAMLHGQNLLYISHQDIAYDLNTSREVVSRLLKQLERQNKIKLGRNKIDILTL